MPSYNRCVFGCDTTGVTIHKFPNPAKYPELFRKWVALAADSLRGMTDVMIHRNRTVCYRHFAENVRNRNNRLNKLAVPTLHLPKHSIPLLDLPSSSSSSSGVPDSPNNQEKDNTKIHETLPPASDQSDPPDIQEDCQSYIILLDENELGSPDIVEKCQPIRHTQIVATSGLADNDLSGSQDIVEKCQPVRNTQIVATTGLADSDLSGSNMNPIMEHNYSTISKPEPKPVKGLSVKDVLIKEQQRKIKLLRSEVCRLRKRNAALKQRLRGARRPPGDSAYQQLTKNMDTPAKLLINMQKLGQKSAKGRRFATDEKELCLSLFKRNPDSYKMLKEYLILPSCKVLAKMKQQIQNTTQG